MTRRVRILDDVVVNQIAAGEVVERPASVVKELIENSIDAGASSITVVIENGGRRLIEVIDDGCGMTRDDALLAMERFGTSKITQAGDLYSLSTLGFRGEALPSIASVSKCTLTTCPGDDAPGVEIIIHGGRLRDVTERPSPKGTRVAVSNLFFNMPARRKFLRAESTEGGLIKSLIGDVAAAFPELRLRLVIDGEQSLQFPAVAGFFERARQLRAGGKTPLRISHEPGGGVRIVGVIAPPAESTAGSGRLRLIVNRRSVRDSLLLRAVRDGYGGFLKPGRYPSGTMMIELPPDEVDVNVHPQKTEVRFRNPAEIFAAVQTAVRSALSAVSPEDLEEQPQHGAAARDVAFSPRPSIAPYRQHALVQPEFFGGTPERRAGTAAQPSFAYHPGEGMPSQSPNAPQDAAQALGSMRYVGQLFKLYLIFEGLDKAAVMDMHAAHERVMFHRIKSQLLEGTVAAQVLLMPVVVELPPDRLEAFAAARPGLERMGLSCEQFGESAIVIRTMPALLGDTDPAGLLTDLLSLPAWSNWQGELDKRADGVIARLACHSSVRSGRELDAEEAYELVRSLAEAEASGFCPHGRPVVYFISRFELEQRFDRS